MKKRTDHIRRIPYQLEELDPVEVDKAYQEWLDEDDGTDDYPSLGTVLAIRFGRPKTENGAKYSSKRKSTIKTETRLRV